MESNSSVTNHFYSTNMSQKSGLIDISDQVNEISDTLLLFKDHTFELFKSNRPDSEHNRTFDIFTCQCKKSHRCRMSLRKDCSSSEFYLLEIHSSWKHNHLSAQEKQRKLELQKERELKTQKEQEIILRNFHLNRMKQKDSTLTPPPIQEVFNTHLSKSGIFLKLPDDIIRLISTFVPYEELFILRGISMYLLHVLARPDFYSFYAKIVFKINLQNYYSSKTPKKKLEYYYRYVYLKEIDDEQRKLLKEMKNWLTDDMEHKIPHHLNTFTFATHAIRKNIKYLPFFHLYFHEKKFVLKAVSIDGQYALSILSSLFINDRDVVLAAIEENPRSYHLIPKKLQEDIEIAIYTFRRFYKNKNLRRRYWKKHPLQDYRFPLSVLKNHKFWSIIGQKYPYYFVSYAQQFLEKKVLKKVVVQAVKKNHALFSALEDEELKNDHEIIAARNGTYK